MDLAPEELLIDVIARLLEGCRHVAVGVSSPLPGSAALLLRERSGGRVKVSIIGATDPAFRTEGGVDMFDSAARGRIDAFFLSGGQIDGAGNINLVGVGGSYPRQEVRWAGSFGSAFLYYVVPRVILFREEHTRRTLVPQVDFISAAGSGPAGARRTGGPIALVTGRCLFAFDAARGRFRLESVHPGHSVEEVLEHTGFDFDLPDTVPETPVPDAETLSILRGPVANMIANPYPRFAARLFGEGRFPAA